MLLDLKSCQIFEVIMVPYVVIRAINVAIRATGTTRAVKVAVGAAGAERRVMRISRPGKRCMGYWNYEAFENFQQL